MAERNITEDDIRAVINNPDMRYPDRKGNPGYVRTLNGRRIRVVIERGSDPFTIITVIVQGI